MTTEYTPAEFGDHSAERAVVGQFGEVSERKTFHSITRNTRSAQPMKTRLLRRFVVLNPRRKTHPQKATMASTTSQLERCPLTPASPFLKPQL